MTLTSASIQNRQATANQIDGYVSGEIAMPPPVVHRTQRAVATCSHLELLGPNRLYRFLSASVLGGTEFADRSDNAKVEDLVRGIFKEAAPVTAE